MWSFLSGFNCGQHGQLEPPARVLPPPKATKEVVTQPAAEDGGGDRVVSASLIHLQKLLKDEKVVGNEAEVERAKIEFLYEFRPKHEVSLSDEEAQTYQQERELLEVKSRFLRIRPDSRFTQPAARDDSWAQS